MGFLSSLTLLVGVLGVSLAFNCPESDGHFQHELRCDLYYWCVNNVAHVTHCPPGSFFSTITNFCNWPYAVHGCTDDGARTDVGGGWSQPQPQPQPPPRHQQEHHQQQQHLNSWERDNDWGNDWDTPRWDSFMAKAFKGSNAKKERTKREVPQGSHLQLSRKTRSVVKGFQCPNSYGYFRHPTTCNEYIWCIDSVPRLMECLGNTRFDANIVHCNQRYAVTDCDENDRRLHPDRTPFRSDVKRHSISKRSEKPVVRGYQCPGNYGYYRHPTSCNLYVRCIDGVPYQQQCEGNKYFDKRIVFCNHQWYVTDCDNNGRRTNPETTPFKHIESAEEHLPIRRRRSPVIVEGYQCPGNYGYYRHPTMCGLYVRCVDGVPRQLQCEGNKYFDEKIVFCNRPWLVDDCDESGRRTKPEPSVFRAKRAVTASASKTPFSHLGVYPPTTVDIDEPEIDCHNAEDGLWGDPIDCTVYYNCQRGQGTQFECSPGTFFNPRTMVCSWPGEVSDCNADGTVKDIFTRKRRAATDMDESEWKIPPITETYNCPDIDGFYRHRTNCSIYFRCTQGQSTAFMCNTGTFFKLSIPGCAFADEVSDCNADGTVKDIFTRKRRAATDMDESEWKIPPITETYNCPDIDGFYRHKTNCSIYFRCTQGQSTAFMCNTGTFFKLSIPGCAFADEVSDCNADGTVKDIFTRKRRAATDMDESEWKIPPITETYNCPDMDGFYRHRTNCSIYFRCTQGQSTAFMCNTGTFFKLSIPGCAFADEVTDCSADGRRIPVRRRRSIFSAPGQKSPPQFESSNFRCPNLMDGNYRDPTDCTVYYWCVSQKATKYACPNGTFFNPKMRICTWPSQVMDCGEDGIRISNSPYQSRIREFTCPNEDGYYRHPVNCATYFRCNERKLTVYECTPGTVFDPNNDVCTWPDQVSDCIDGKVISSSFKVHSAAKENTTLRAIARVTTTADVDNGTVSPTNTTNNDTTMLTTPIVTTSNPATTKIASTPSSEPSTEKTPSTTDTPSETTAKLVTKGKKGSTTSGTTEPPSTTQNVQITTKATKATKMAKEDNSTATETKNVTSSTDNSTHVSNVPINPLANDGFGHESNIGEATAFGAMDDSGFMCPRPGGYFMDMEDCASYFHCEYGVAYKRECGQGDFYSPLSEACIPGHLVPDCNYDDEDAQNYPEWTKDYYKSYVSDFECPSLHGYYPDETDCSGYLECINGNAYARKCNDGTNFDDIKKKCTWEASSKGCPKVNKNRKVSQAIGEIIETEPFVCPMREGYFRDPKTCTMFYECKEGVPKSRACGPDTLFDDIKKKCTWPELVKGCDVYGRVVNKDDSVFTGKEPHQMEKNPSGFVCPLPSGHFRDPRDCAVFYHCVKSVAYKGKCQGRHVFDLEALKCLDPELVPGCDIAPKAPLIKKPDEKPNEGASLFECKSDGYFRDQSDCAVYFMCKDGVYFRNKCKPGTVFSTEKNMCTWPHLVAECEAAGSAPTTHNDVIPESMSEVPPAEIQWEAVVTDIPLPIDAVLQQIPSTESQEKEIKLEQTVFNEDELTFTNTEEPVVKIESENDDESKIESEGNDESNIESEGNDDSASSSPLTSLQVDINRETEEITGGKPLQGETEFTCPEVFDGFYGDPTYCQKFYRCANKKKYSFTCPAGTFFDGARYICNFKEKVPGCTDSGLRISQEAGNDAPEKAPVVVTIVTPEPKPLCPESDGLFPHPSSCSKFLYCARYTPMVLSCPKDLVYNMEKKTCDYSDNVVCIRYD